MNYSKTLSTILICGVFFYLFNNPSTIRKFKIKRDNTNLICYTVVYSLLLYSTIKIINFAIKDDITEHFNYKESIDIISKNYINSISSDKKCQDLYNNYISNLKKDTELKKTIEEHGFTKCKEKIDNNELCHKLDMSRYILKNSIPDCSRVLPEQYGLFKPRKGGSSTDDDDDDSSKKNTIIDKDNYIIFYLLFVFLIISYIIVVIGKSIFENKIH